MTHKIWGGILLGLGSALVATLSGFRPPWSKLAG